MRLPDQHPASRIEIAHPDLRRISRFRGPDQSFAVRRKPRSFLVIWRWIQPPRFTAVRRHDPQMRNPRVRFQIDIYAIEHDPFAIRRWHRRADALQFHHVLECEWTLLRWRLREHRGREQKECCEKTFHKRPSFRLTPTGASSVLGSARLWRVGDRILRSRTFVDLRLLVGVSNRQSSSPQNAATSTLQACAPQNSTRLARARGER